MDEKRDETETELEGDLAIDDETAGEVTGGKAAGPHHFQHHKFGDRDVAGGPKN
ncbi:MAG: hypothetical protein ACLQNG_05385 [Acidimicrobiales bacterium]|jgi:hypothetical protein